MKKIIIFIFSLNILLFCEVNNTQIFMTDIEYGSMFYQNPRSIGCDKCHGLKGEKTLIAKYKHKGKQKFLYAPDIRNLSDENFSKVFRKNNKIMPKYFLTDDEIKTLHNYIKEVNKK